MIVAFLFFLCLVPQDKPAQPEGNAYPTFEPFIASRMLKRFDPQEADLQDLRRQLETMAKATEAGRLAGKQFVPPENSRVSALLEPEVEEEHRMIAWLVPVVLMKLEPLWTTDKWTPAEIEEARAGAEILGLLPECPKVAFIESKDADNHAALEKLVRWYRALVGRPEWYAAMIITFDDGPYRGLPYEAAAILPAEAGRRLDDHTELNLCRVERETEPWVLQAVRDGKPLWSRVISAAPDGSVAEASFLEDPVQRVGPYGWKVRLLVGEELSEVFLDPKGDLLFYFLSW